MKVLELVEEVKQAILSLNCAEYGGYKIQESHADERARNIVMGFQGSSRVIDESELNVVIHALSHYAREDSKAMSPAHRIIARSIAKRMSEA